MNTRAARPASLTAMALTMIVGCAEPTGPRDPDGGPRDPDGPSGGTQGVGGSGNTGNVPTFAGSGNQPSFGGAQGFSGSPGFAGTPAAAGTPGAAGASATCVPGSAKAAAGVIDNMEDGDNAIGLMPPFVGYWYVYNDGTGTQTPAKDEPPGSSPFYGTAGGATTPMFAACSKGSGFTMWGAGIGFNLQDIAGKACAIDASTVTGIRFQAKGTGSVRLQIASAPTATAANGGTCVAATGCDYHSNAPITLTPSWSAVSIPWTMMMPGVAALDATKMLAIQFQAFGDGSIPAFDFCVDDIEFY